MKYLPLLLLLAGCAEKIQPTTMSDEEIALKMQCHDRHGLLAMGHGPEGEWVTCWQGKKRIWGVKL